MPIRRSQVAFIRGAWTAVRKILALAARKTASKERVKSGPLTWSFARFLVDR